MSPSPSLADAPLTSPAADAKLRGEMTDPKLGAALRADYEALQNDFQQANELASDFQRELAGKSNELAHMKRVFEKTQEDLVQLQASITALREERHRLANEAMRAVALERRVAVITADRDRLHAEVEVLRHSGAANSDETVRRLRERDAQVAQLVIEIESLRQRVAFSSAPPATAPERPAPPRISPELKAAVAAVADALEELTHLVYPETAARPAKQLTPRAEALALESEEFIDIAFSE